MNKTIKLTKTELKNLVSEQVKILAEGVAFEARRRIRHEAAEAAMNFEDRIANHLDLMDRDEMHDEHQQKYLEIVSKMQRQLVDCVDQAMQEIIQANLPKKIHQDKSTKV